MPANQMVRAIRTYTSIPIIAIGGINLSNVKEVIQSGADGLCAISAVVTKRDVKREIEKFQELFHHYNKEEINGTKNQRINK